MKVGFGFGVFLTRLPDFLFKRLDFGLAGFQRLLLFFRSVIADEFGTSHGFTGDFEQFPDLRAAFFSLWFDYRLGTGAQAEEVDLSRTRKCADFHELFRMCRM